MENIIHIYNIIFYSVQHKNICAVENLFDDIQNSVNVDCHIFSNYSLHNFNLFTVSSKSSSTFLAACLFFLAKKQILYKTGSSLLLLHLLQLLYNPYFPLISESHLPHFGNFPFLKILWIVPVFEASLLLS